MIHFTLILVSAIAGLAGLGWWVIPITGLALHLTISDFYRGMRPRFKAIDRTYVLYLGWAASIMQALIATGAAFAIGRLVAWL